MGVSQSGFDLNSSNQLAITTSNRSRSSTHPFHNLTLGAGSASNKFKEYKKKRLSISRSKSEKGVSPIINWNSNQQSRKKTTPFVTNHLSETFRKYGGSIQTLEKFWNKNIISLCDGTPSNEALYRELCLLFYTKLFTKLPQSRFLFLNKNIEFQSFQYMNMIGWLIRSLIQPNAVKLIKKLKKLGKQHLKMGIKEEYYPIMLRSLHESLEEFLPNKYTVRIRFCFEQLFTAVSDIMTFKDFTEYMTSVAIRGTVMDYIISLDTCLQHPIGTKYLELYMKQQFCVELLFFHYKYQHYKCAISEAERTTVGFKLMTGFIDIGSPMEVNISYDCRTAIKKSFHEYQLKSFTETLFDEAYAEIRTLIQSNCWRKFQSTMLDLTGEKDEYRRWKAERQRKQSRKSMSHLNQFQSQSRTIEEILNISLAPKSVKSVKYNPSHHNKPMSINIRQSASDITPLPTENIYATPHGSDLPFNKFNLIQTPSAPKSYRMNSVSSQSRSSMASLPSNPYHSIMGGTDIIQPSPLPTDGPKFPQKRRKSIDLGGH